MDKTVTNVVSNMCVSVSDEFHGYVCTLLEKWPPRFGKLREKRCSVPNYEGLAVCYIAILIKMLFGIDGHTERWVSSANAAGSDTCDASRVRVPTASRTRHTRCVLLNWVRSTH